MGGYMKFEGIEGEVADKDHKGWTEIQSFSHGVSKQSGGATGAARQRADTELHDFVVSKISDKSTPKLFEASANGKVFPKVEVHLTATYTDAGRVNYLIYELEHVAISSYHISGSGEGVPNDNFVLNHEKFKMTYTENDEKGKKKGNVETTWDVRAGKK